MSDRLNKLINKSEQKRGGDPYEEIKGDGSTNAGSSIKKTGNFGGLLGDSQTLPLADVQDFVEQVQEQDEDQLDMEDQE
jgi:hypothetical protein